MGPWTFAQKILLGVLALMLTLWATKSLHGLGTGLVAWIGVLVIVVCGAVSWSDIVKNDGAWDALIWLGGLITMANALRDEKVVSTFAGLVKDQISGLGNLPVLAILVILALVYFYSMYGFSMLTGHILALAAAFFAIAKGFSAPALLSAGLIAYFSNLCACTTNYSTGPVIIYFGLGYVEAPAWFRIGGLVSLFHMAVWLGVGLPWWKLLGWY